MIKTLDRYILARFFRSLGTVTVAVGILIVAINMIEELRDFIDHDAPFRDIAIYYLYFGGWILRSFLPLFVFLACLFTIGSLARTNEILAIKAGGVSLLRTAAPLLVAGAVLSVAHFYYNEVLYPPANARRLEIKEFNIDKVARGAVVNRYNIYRRISDSAYYVVDVYSVPDRRASGVKIYERSSSRLGEFITAEEMTFEKGGWVAHNGLIRKFTDSSGAFEPFKSLALPMIKEAPEDFENKLGKPEDMGYTQLQRYIELLKRTGGSYTSAIVDLKFKLAFPMASLIVVILSVPLASRQRRGGIAGALALAAGFILVYFVAFKVMKSLGSGGVLDPDLAVWSVNGVFILIGAILNFSFRK